jgi:hypothetical protein
MQAYARAVALIVPAMVSLTLLVVLWRRNNKRGGASKPFYTVVCVCAVALWSIECMINGV